MIPQNQKFMQLTMSPFEHMIFSSQKRYNNEAYWKYLPTYIIARCPFCGVPYTGKLDVHSLLGWGTFDSESGLWFFDDKREKVGCDHRLAVQRFVNLEGHLPSELKRYFADLHVPFVMPFLIPDDIRSSAAVIHSFTICRLESQDGRVYDYVTKAFRDPLKAVEEMMLKEHKFRKYRPIEEMPPEDKATLEKAIFVPRYTAYAVTYYADVSDHQTLIDRRMKPQLADMKEDPEYEPVWLAAMGEMHSEPHAYDLLYWIEQGKLQWLDLDQPDLPLKSGPLRDFPYINIQFDRGNLYRMRF